MSFICGLKMDKKVVLWIAILFALIVAVLSMCSCISLDDSHISVNDIFSKDAVRQHVNEKCRVFRNWGISDDAFQKYVYYMVDGTDWISVRVIRWTGATYRRGTIISMVVYYEHT